MIYTLIFNYPVAHQFDTELVMILLAHSAHGRMVLMMFALVDCCIIQYCDVPAHIILIYYTMTLVFATCARESMSRCHERENARAFTCTNTSAQALSAEAKKGTH
jgi:hypothetical protein